MIAVVPVVRIQERHTIIAFRYCQLSANPPGRVSVVAMRDVQLDMAHADVVQECLRMPVTYQTMVALDRLLLHTGDTALDGFSTLFVVWRNDCNLHSQFPGPRFC